jgi:hypothetical protein
MAFLRRGALLAPLPWLVLAVLGCSAGSSGDDSESARAVASGAQGTGGHGEGGAGGAGGDAGAPSGDCGNDTVDPGEECDGGPSCDASCQLIDDADGDGISDDDEGTSDSDGDGTDDYQDTDSDDDGIPDAVEAGDDELVTAPVDTDGDGTPDFQDEDADDDGVADSVEAGADPLQPVDSDGDFTPDYLDSDSDNDDLDDADEIAAGTGRLDPDSDDDTISDGDDGDDDDDNDGAINALDPDSDNDGYSDALEAGDGDWQTLPVDSDFDGILDFLDLDSEQDGLPDALEVSCPAILREGRLWPDSDFDTFPDVAEVLVGSNPCDAASDPYTQGVEFFFILPYQDPEQSSPLRFVPTVKRADVFFNVDTTGSMGGEIANLQAGIGTIITSTQARVSDAGFGVASFEDFPFAPFGAGGDAPFDLRQGITTNTSAAQIAVNGLALGNGGDFPESGYEALYQVGAGTGVFGSGGSFGPFTTAGRIGGAQFRPGALPIAFHVTDALSHEAGIPTTFPGCVTWTADYPGGYNDHSRAQALSALGAIGARVVTVQTQYPAGVCLDGVNNGITNQTYEISQATGAVVPVCGFQIGPNANDPADWRCGINSCCAGTIASGSECILRYTVAENGTGLTEAAVDGVDAIVKYTKFDVYADQRDDGSASTIDTSLFLQRVEANTPDDSFKPPAEPERSCTPVPMDGAFYATTYNDGFYGFAVGSSNVAQEGAKLFFTVVAQNDFLPHQSAPQLFVAYIDIVDDTTGSVLDTQEVVIIVPAAPGGAGD